MHELKMNI